LDRGNRWDQFQGNRQEWVADRHQDLQNRLENRQDFRNDWQDNRQDFLNDRREDWQNQLEDRYPWHDNWHHGYWHDRWGGYWEHMWEEHPVWAAFGVTSWALNSAGYMFGTWDYSNPYYDAAYASASPYDYSQPIVIYSEPVSATTPIDQAASEASTLPPGVSQDALNQFDQARLAFGQGNYQQSLDLANQALKSMPSDATLHEFRALCLFALGRYHEAAATLNAVLAVGPGWDWTTMVSLYPDVEVYTSQLRKLEDYVKLNPAAFDARFVLAYHYLTMNHLDAAAKELEDVVKSVPNDAVARQLYDMLTYKAFGEPTLKAEPLAPAGPKLTAEGLVGTWKAKGPSNSAFEMTLTKDGAFTWKYTKGKKEQMMKGAYAVDQNTLAMEPAAGGVMLATVAPQSNGAISFKMIGSPEKDPPLNFTRQ
jgi:tetratricopeptide (TPR) repeat protein